MRIERLIVENLGPLRSVDLDLSGVTVLMGPNESGKSFVIDALEVLRYGSTRGIKAKDSMALTRSGMKGWAVEALVRWGEGDGDEGIPLRRTRSSAPDLATLEGALGDARLFRALLRTGTFLDMKPADRRALVADLLAQDTTAIVERLYGLNADADILEAAKGGDLRKAHRIATEARRALTREVKSTEAVVAEGVEDVEVQTKAGQRAISTLTLQAIDRALARAHERAGQARDEHAAAEAVRTQREAAEQAKATLEGMGGAHKWTEGSRLEEVKRACDKNRVECQRLNAERDLARQTEGSLRDLLKRDGDCPTCGQDLAPAQAKATKVADELAKKQSALARSIDENVAEHKALTEERKALEERHLAWQRDLGERQRLQAIIDNAKGLAKEVQESNALDSAQAEVLRLQSVRDTRLQYDARTAAVEQAQARLDSLRHDEAIARDVEEAVTPDTMEDEAGALDSINDRLKAWTSAVFEDATVEVTEGWLVEYQGRDVALASDSARIRCGLLLALALAYVSDARCVFVDRFEALDDAQRKRCLALLGRLTRAGELHTAVVAVVKDEPKGPPKIPSWLQVVALDDGNARVLGPGEE